VRSDGFEVKIEVHQCSVLSPCCSSLSWKLSSESGVVLPWELFYADDLCLLAETGGFGGEN
jgi:hypothetical protein